MIPLASNVRMPMIPSGDGASLLEKRVLAVSSLTLTHSVTQVGDKNKALEDWLLLDDHADWHNNHGEDPGASVLNLVDSASFNIEMLRPLESVLNMVDHVHIALEGYHPPMSDNPMIAGETMYIGQPVYVPSNNTVNLADASSVATANALGLAITDAVAGSSVIVRTEGTVSLSDWTLVIGTTLLTPGAIYFLDLSAGMMSTLPPDNVGEVVVRMGIAITTTEFDIEVNEVAVL